MPESPNMEREEWSHLPIINGKVGEGVKFERIRRITGYLVEGYFQKAGEGLAIPPENRAFLTRFYRCAMMGVSLDWLEGGMETDLLAEAEFLCRLMEQSGQQALLLGHPPIPPV